MSATPGPWATDPEYNHEQVIGPDGITVADCLIIALDSGPSRETIQANAHLIAAAPEMLKALLRILDWNDGTPPLGDEPWLEMCEIARVALAKARSEQ